MYKKRDFSLDFVTFVKFTYIVEGTHNSIINEIPIMLSAHKHIKK